MLSGTYKRPTDLTGIPVPFVHDAGLGVCRASASVLAETEAGLSPLETEGWMAARQVLLRSGEHWLSMSLDTSVADDVARQAHQAGDRHRVRQKLSLEAGATGGELERYAGLRRRVKW